MRGTLAALCLGVACWWGLAASGVVPEYLLAGPAATMAALWHARVLLAGALLTTAEETLLGLVLGTALGAAAALLLAALPRVQRAVMPLLLVAQAVPVFALAPLLVLWLGYGLASKVAAAVLIIFFPVTASLADGLARTDPALLDLARTMGAGRLSLLLRVRVPAALPAFGSGLRIAAAVAPAGAVIGEWVGASAGLGSVMIGANARGDLALSFAALLLLSGMTVILWGAVDKGLSKAFFFEKKKQQTFISRAAARRV